MHFPDDKPDGVSYLGTALSEGLARVEAAHERPTSIYTTRIISHDEAREIAQRLINSLFRKEPYARIGIPARPDYDDDLLICAYIEQQRERP